MERAAIAVIGAGVVGSAVACALAREGHSVVLVDRAEPGLGGASFGNVGHIAAELVEPLPSPALLFGFWKQLIAFGGPLDLPLRRVPGMLPWIARFASAAFRREENTKWLAPLVRASRPTLERCLREIGRSDLLRCNGHYEIWLNERALESARTQARVMERLGVPTEVAPPDLLESAARAVRSSGSGSRASHEAAGLWFPESGHVADPLEVVRAFAAAAAAQGAEIRRADVRAIEVAGNGLRIVARATNGATAQSTGLVPPPAAETSRDTSHPAVAPSTADSALAATRFDALVVCAGAWSRALLEPFGLKVPMQVARGYHIEIPGHTALVDAPIVYSDHSLLVTPMAGRLRCSTYMEFAAPDAPADARKPRRLREKVRAVGYDCPLEGPSWVGPRPVLPDYLPGIGRLPAGSPNVFYAIGHQHIGLTLAAVTGDLVADLVAERTPRHDVSAFDLRRFG
ncbi:MAG TPA: FAD-binding oxidoreductase [Steroidobacteraceae bacterium]|nr:FAD-binding oxidoreductase [Steroidobacteraceae bacterium]